MQYENFDNSTHSLEQMFLGINIQTLVEIIYIMTLRHALFISSGFYFEKRDILNFIFRK